VTRYCEDYIAVLAQLSLPSVKDDSQSDDSKPAASVPSSAQVPQRPDNENENLRHSHFDPSKRIHPYQNERWLERYQDLLEYHSRRGHCNVPHVYTANPSLGQWVKRQRHQYKLQTQGQHSHLTRDRMQILEMLGFIWDSHGAAWEENSHELKEFRRIHSHCNVPCAYQGNPKLSTWIKRQRRQYRWFAANQPSTMTLERVLKLENLGLIWDYYGSKPPPSTKSVAL
jgi:hypothetical protein